MDIDGLQEHELGSCQGIEGNEGEQTMKETSKKEKGIQEIVR